MKNKSDSNSIGIIIGIIVLILGLVLALWFVLKPVEDSNNSNLDSLVIANYPITFSSDTTTYSINVDENVDSIEVTAVPEDKNANVVITGNTNIQNGSNEIKITVTAQDGTSKVYTIHVNKTTDNGILDNNDMNNDDNNVDNNTVIDKVEDKINDVTDNIMNE